jgi:glycosyltransferase involved in cell wall biosynthesis
MNSHTEAPFLSVVIPVLNEEQALPRCLASVREGARDIRHEIIVVDDGSTDRSLAIAEERADHLERCRGETIAELRNIGVRASQGNYLLLLDADMAVPSGLLQDALSRLNAGFEGIFAYGFVSPPEAGWVGRVWGDHTVVAGEEGKAVDFLSGRNLFLTRNLFDRLQGFRAELVTGEDKDFSLRAAMLCGGNRLYPQPLLLHYGYERSLGEFCRKEYWRQSSALPLLKLWGYAPRLLRNPLFSLATLISLLLALATLPFDVVAAGGLLLLWAAPSFVVAARRFAARRPMKFVLQFGFLTLLRWTIAGAAVLAVLAGQAVR